MIALSTALAAKADCYIDDQHERHSQLGVSLFQTFDYDRRSGRVSTQVRNLQQIVCSATRFSDIEDFIKNQMGKDTDLARKWREIGDDLLKQLRCLRDKASKMDSAPETQLALRLRLARGWVRAVVSEYLYRIAQHQMESSHAQHSSA